LYASVASAQITAVTGILTGHIGAARGGDITAGGLTPGASIAIVETTGIGAELDFAHTRTFSDVFDDSAITSFMVNALGLWPHPTLRPFLEGGIGLVRVRAALDNGQAVVSRTDWGINAGGGVLFMFNDAVGVRGDLRYFRLLQRHDDIPLNDPGFFDFWRASVGVSWTWPVR
jgi:hypothetical protein